MDIQISKVTVKVGPERRALFEIPEFRIESGAQILVKGASGKGKTTFLHLLAGLFVPDEGRVRVGGAELTGMGEEERAAFRRRHIGIVFQKLNLLEHLTALENIELSLRGRHDVEKASHALRSVGLAGREHDRTAVLSLGEQQRVAIARVLVGEAALVFADEPTSSLDEKNALEAAALLVRACKGKTLVVVSHDRRIETCFPETLDFDGFAK